MKKQIKTINYAEFYFNIFDNGTSEMWHKDNNILYTTVPTCDENILYAMLAVYEMGVVDGYAQGRKELQEMMRGSLGV